MHIEIFTAFNKGDAVFSDEYGTGVVTAISARFLLLPSDEKDEEISYFVRFSGQEELVDQNRLRASTDA